MVGDGIAECGHRATSITYVGINSKQISGIERNLRHEPSSLQNQHTVEQQESFRQIERYVSLLS
jgi:hypothetical protein